MPKGFEEKVKKRGGAKRWRTIKRPDGTLIRVAVVRKKGPHGGHTLGYELNPDK